MHRTFIMKFVICQLFSLLPSPYSRSRPCAVYYREEKTKHYRLIARHAWRSIRPHFHWFYLCYQCWVFFFSLKMQRIFAEVEWTQMKSIHKFSILFISWINKEPEHSVLRECEQCTQTHDKHQWYHTKKHFSTYKIPLRWHLFYANFVLRRLTFIFSVILSEHIPFDRWLWQKQHTQKNF